MSSDTQREGSNDGGTSTTPDAAAPVPPCDDQETAALQAVLDGAHPAKTDVVAAIKTACGVRYFNSGPAKVEPTTVHRIASVSKTYTGGIVLQLVEEGLVSFDDPASKWIEGIPGGDAVHVRHLLQHMSGLGAPSSSTTAKVTPAELLSSSFKKGSQFKPGSKFEYQNINYVALGVIAEKVTTKSLPALVRERISTKLGLAATFFEGGETVTSKLAPAENAQGNPGNYNVHSSYVWGAGSMLATPADTVTWIEAFGSGQFFGAKTVTEMRKGVDVGGAGVTYGFATMILDPSVTFGGGVGYGHFGDLISGSLLNGNCGYHTAAFYFPERKTTVVTVLDYSPSDLQTAHDLFNAVVKALFTPK